MRWAGQGRKYHTAKLASAIRDGNFDGWDKFRAFERTAGAGEAMMMALGTGHVFGRVVIVGIGEVHDHIGYAGLPRKLQFDIEVVRYGGEYGGFSGGLFW